MEKQNKSEEKNHEIRDGLSPEQRKRYFSAMDRATQLLLGFGQGFYKNPTETARWLESMAHYSQLSGVSLERFAQPSGYSIAEFVNKAYDIFSRATHDHGLAVGDYVSGSVDETRFRKCKECNILIPIRDSKNPGPQHFLCPNCVSSIFSRASASMILPEIKRMKFDLRLTH